jgi:hypothetical protein
MITNIEHTIPDLKMLSNQQYISAIQIFDGKKLTAKRYLRGIGNFERECEREIIKTFAKIAILGRVKTNPYSLPYTHEVVTKLGGTGMLPPAFEFYRVARPIVEEMLNKDVYKIRFYFFVDISITPNETFINQPYWYVTYSFRYHLPSAS